MQNKISFYWKVRMNDSILTGPFGIRFWNRTYSAIWRLLHPWRPIVKAIIYVLFGGRMGVGMVGRIVVKTPKGRIYGIHEMNTSTLQFEQLTQVQIFNTGLTLKDTSGNTHALSANQTITAVNFTAGIGTTAANFSDYALGSPVAGASGYAAATMNAPSGSSYTITATITNSSGNPISYAEIGVTVTIGGNVFLVSHDVSSAYPVSAGGQLNCTETASFA